MPNPYFSFKQFTVYHDRCAMKVGTDGVLLGAWADVTSASRILDIGTGTGLIALMLAQRSNAQIAAIDIDLEAVAQARQNILNSKWSDRIKVEHCDLCSYSPNQAFDCIVSNPPYFIDSLNCPDDQRNTARHTISLSFENLIRYATQLLAPQGVFSVIIPTDEMDRFIHCATENSLSLSRQTLVYTKPGALPKRVLLAFQKESCAYTSHSLVIELSRHVYSEEYIALTKDFYLKM